MGYSQIDQPSYNTLITHNNYFCLMGFVVWAPLETDRQTDGQPSAHCPRHTSHPPSNSLYTSSPESGKGSIAYMQTSWTSLLPLLSICLLCVEVFICALVQL